MDCNGIEHKAAVWGRRLAASTMTQPFSIPKDQWISFIHVGDYTPSRGADEMVKLAEVNVIPREQYSWQENPGRPGTGQLKCDGTRAETRFRLLAK